MAYYVHDEDWNITLMMKIGILRYCVATLALCITAVSGFGQEAVDKDSPAAVTPVLSVGNPGAGKDSLAVVDLSVAHLREAPDYTAEMGTEVLMGAAVKVLERRDYWRKVLCDDGYTAWVNALALKEMDIEEMKAYEASPKLVCISEYATVHSAPKKSSPMVSDLVRGDILMDGKWFRDGKSVTGKKSFREEKFVPGKDGFREEKIVSGNNGERDEWIETVRKGFRDERRESGKEGWAKKADRRGFCYVSTVSGRSGWVQKSALMKLEDWKASQRCTGDAVADEALRHLGIPYLWGGASPKGFDCSGLSSFCFRMNGRILPRNASAQARLGTAVDTSGIRSGNCSALRRGDLVFFGNPATSKVSHVGIYIGEGRMVHASQLVRINSLIDSRPDCYENMHRLLAVRRLCGEE